MLVDVDTEEVEADNEFEEVFEEETRPGELGLSSEARLALRSLRRIPGARGPSPDICEEEPPLRTWSEDKDTDDCSRFLVKGSPFLTNGSAGWGWAWAWA